MATTRTKRGALAPGGEATPLLESDPAPRPRARSRSHDEPTAREASSETVPESDTDAGLISNAERVCLFSGVFLVGYAYGLDSQVRGTYQPYATSSLNLHSSHSTINVLRSVMAVVSQPTAAKIADIYGRFETVSAAIVLYAVGTALEASATSVEMFCVGAVLYQIGWTCVVLLLEVLVADFSSMRSRVVFSYLPAVPFVVNTWISGSVTAAVLGVGSWRWGIGMWAVIMPICSLPLLASLRHLGQRRRRIEDDGESKREATVDLFHKLDIVGLVLLLSAFTFTLAPLTLAGGTVSHWGSPGIVCSLALGLACIPAFAFWEGRHARVPIIPVRLLREPGVWSALAIRSLLNLAWSTQGNYLYTVLVVAFGFSIEVATRILSFFSFFGVLSGILVGVVIYRTRRLKSIIIAGTCLFTASFVLLVLYPGGATGGSQRGLMAAQIVMGLAGGLFAYPTQASIQASVDGEHVAIVTSLYLSVFNVGNAVGNCLSGALWTQLLYPSLQQNLAFQSNTTLARAVYSSPFSAIEQHPVGGQIREAIIDSYRGVQRLLCVAGLVVCLPMVGFAFALRNPRLSEERVQPEARPRSLVDEEAGD